MILEIRKELLKRIMGLQLSYSKGEDYAEKLENSYKTNLVIILFLVSVVIGLSTRLISNISYTQDVIQTYKALDSSNGKYISVIDNLIISNKSLTKELRQCKIENQELNSDITILSNRIRRYNSERENGGATNK